MLLYLLIGIGLTMVLHLGLRELARIKEHHPEHYRRILATGGMLGLLAIVSRIGVGAFTNLLWALAAVLPFVKHPKAASGAGPARSSSAMTRSEAARILGVAENASDEEIHTAWRKQMQRNHPDQGGSEYLASQINQAKDVLLKKS